MIIGINGYIGSGKDTVGSIIQYLVANKNLPKNMQYHSLENLDNGVELYSNWKIKKFAGKLKTIASLLTGVPVEKFEDQEFKKTFLGPEWASHSNPDDFLLWGESGRPMTVREFLQKLGTEAIRVGLHTNAWVNSLFADYKKDYKFYDEDANPHGYPNWIITDTRFPNEAQAIKDRGGIVVRVNRDESVTGTFSINHKGWKLKSNIHPSETNLDSWDFDYVLENNGSIEELIPKVKTMLEHFKLL